jgi:DNA-binding transcriptional LysR family regulator
MHDLNDLFAFAKVVQHSGFSAAARALHVTKSSLSKRVARLKRRGRSNRFNIRPIRSVMLPLLFN